MKVFLISLIIFLFLAATALYLNGQVDYFGSNFEATNYWLVQANANVVNLNSYEEFDKPITLYDFPNDQITFAAVSYEDEFGEPHSYSIPWGLIGKAFYSVKKVDNKNVVKLLTAEEAVKAVSEWRTTYTFGVVKSDPSSNKSTILKVYIHEPV